MRKYGDNELSGAQKAYNRYVIVVTSLTDGTPEMVLDLYRQRWQIEMAFKRLKLDLKLCFREKAPKKHQSRALESFQVKNCVKKTLFRCSNLSVNRP